MYVIHGVEYISRPSKTQHHEEHWEEAAEEQRQQAPALLDCPTAAQEAKNQSHSTDKYQEINGWEQFISDLVVCFVVPDVYW